MRENSARLEKRLDSLETRAGTLERDVGWIKGNWKVNKKVAAGC